MRTRLLSRLHRQVDAAETDLPGGPLHPADLQPGARFAAHAQHAREAEDQVLLLAERM